MDFFQIHGCTTRHLHGLRGSAGLFHLAASHKRAVLVAPDAEQMSAMKSIIKTFRPKSRIVDYPPLDGTAFSFTPIHAATRRARIMCCHAMLNDDWDYLITTPRAFLESLPPLDQLLTPRLTLTVGDNYDLTTISRCLVEMGYLSCELVNQPGDFAKRGGILDVFSFVDETAYRLEFFGDELEEIRTFDPSTQRRTGLVDRVDLLPLYEWILNDSSADTFSQRGGELWNQSGGRGRFLDLVSQIRDYRRFPGYLHWTGLFFREAFHFYDHLPPDTLYFFQNFDEVSEIQEKSLRQLDQQEAATTGGKQLSSTRRILFGSDDATRIQLPAKAEAWLLQQLELSQTSSDEFITQTVPNYNSDVYRLIDHWKPHIKRQAVVLVIRTPGLQKRVEELLDENDVSMQHLDFPFVSDLSPGFFLADGYLDSGFAWPAKKLVVISEADVWGKSRKRNTSVMGKAMFQTEFRDLKIGDLVVHLDHGIGKFLGLVEMEAGGAVHEMMSLGYRGNQKLYVNLNQLDLVQRYGSESGSVQLDKLGSLSWERIKTRVKKAVREMAAELIKLYAERQLVPAHVYERDTQWQLEFEESFEHEATAGQLRAVAELKADLESERPMDRLLVGDVGFGKTEVAMRLAFKVVMEGLQVAVLCPTTVLAFQHYHTFKKRFAAFPVKIHWVSRFNSNQEIQDALLAASEGKADILIGTHRLLSKDVQFKRLGALVIDEEQRFGVTHKEQLKKMRKQLDVLSMSATPIPRTLNLSLTGIRDISVIETPPRNRLAIHTTVTASRESLIQNAIEFELERDGQVFFIHNRVESMDTVMAIIKNLVPQARVAMAHGQMAAKELEHVMLKFIKRKIDVLVASTIIENGVDIPNANTMLINRADMFGVSQLYQLRGRIGRSDRPAYAYLLVPPNAHMTPLARKRLATLEEFSELGCGFRIAAVDMELRGAGNMLGAKQAGHINAIGYETYIRLLKEAVDELKGKKIEDQVNCLLKLNLGASLPRPYIEEITQRLSYYKRLAGAREVQEVEAIRDTMRDMFGPLPAPAEQLCREHELRICLSAEGVLSVEREKDRVKLHFHSKVEVNADVVLAWIQERREISISPEGVIHLPLESRNPEDVIARIQADVISLRK